MSPGSGNGAGKAAMEARIKAREQAEMVSSLRRLAKGGSRVASGSAGGSVLTTPMPGATSASESGSASSTAGEEHCDMCGNTIPADHRHLLHLEERSIMCVCESCLAMRAGDAEVRPTGTRVLWLPDFDMPDEAWASFSIPIGLAFFLHSSATGKLSALYPSPAGATESELEMDSWVRLVATNPVLGTLEADIEALIVNRMVEPHLYAIAPIDECYRLVGMIKSAWDGISGGAGPEDAIAQFFEEIHARAEKP